MVRLLSFLIELMIYIDEIPAFVMKGMLNDIYEAFMVHIPHNEIENMVDLAIKGSTCSIKKVSINGNFNIKVNYPRRVLNKLANFTQLYLSSRDINLFNKEAIKLLKESYENSLAAHPTHLLTSRNEFEITYQTNGMSHKKTIPISQDWKILEEGQNTSLSNKTVSKLLYLSKDAIPLQHTPYTIRRKQFIEVMQSLPLINYLYSFEHIGSGFTLTGLTQTIFKVFIIMNY